MKFICIFMILCGMLLIIYDIQRYLKIFKKLEKDGTVKNIFNNVIYKISIILMLFFCIAYFGMLIYFYEIKEMPQNSLLISAILFFGAIFVYVMVLVQERMIKIISEKSVEALKASKKASEAKLALESRRRTQIMLDATPLCCNLMDENGNLIDCNQETLKLFGLKNRKEFSGRFSQLSPEFQPSGQASSELVNLYVARAFTDGSIRFEWVHINLNGEQIPCEVTLVRVKLGSKTMLAGFIRDLREQKAMIQKIKHKEAELRKAKDIAEENARSKGEFLSKMSHELRTPLNGIIGMIKIIENSNDMERIKASAKKMDTASQNLLQTINDILDISKVESGKMELIYDEFNIEDMFKNLFDIIAFSAYEKAIEIKLDMQEKTHATFIGDEKRLSQIYMNFLSNAIKFTPNGGKITITVKYNQRPDGKIELISSVKDTGIGIPQDKIGTLFQSFVQVDNRLARKYTGTGLGLVIAKNIIELMGGRVSVTSRQNVGTTFSFSVLLQPFKKEHEISVEPISKEKELATGEDNFDFSNKTILLFEDVAINREIVQFLLEDTGVTCVEAEDGIQGLKKYNEDPLKYDLILMDIQMPNMDGFEATKMIRTSNQPNAKTIPIIAMTANVFADQIQDTLEAGMNSHLGKPIDGLTVKKELAKYLNYT